MLPLAGLLPTIGFPLRALVGLAVLIGAYFYSGRQKLLKNAAILFGCFFGLLLVLRIALGLLGVYAGLLIWLRSGLPHMLY